jgi:hypothetical protein
MQLTTEHYYRTANERMIVATMLFDRQRYGLSMYVAGLAVECLLRAFRVRKDPVFDSRHDLKLLFRESGILRLHAERLEARGLPLEKINDAVAEFAAAHDIVVRLWRNDYRFAAQSHIRGWLNEIGAYHGIRGDVLKVNALRLCGPVSLRYRSTSVDLKEKVAALLQTAFDPEDLVLDVSDGLGGYIVSETFRGHDSLDRQRMINKVLRSRDSGISKTEQREILIIAAFTPEEYLLHAPD